MARIVALLRRGDVRLLTITDPGGVGKTRVALQAAADLLDAFPDGVWFVDLSALTDPSLVPSAIADALRVREEGSGIANHLAAALAVAQTVQCSAAWPSPNEMPAEDARPTSSCG